MGGEWGTVRRLGRGEEGLTEEGRPARAHACRQSSRLFSPLRRYHLCAWQWPDDRSKCIYYPYLFTESNLSILPGRSSSWDPHRNYYVRYDYEGVDKSRAEAMVGHMTSCFAAVTGQHLAGGYTVAVADEFQYVDPVDGSVSSHQGVRYLFTDGSRVIFRLSGTAGSGATVRMYLEKYEADRSKLGSHPLEALGVLVQVALELSDLEKFTGRKEPTVIT